MEVYTVMFHGNNTDAIVSIFSSEIAAKKRAERCAARRYSASKFEWQGRFLTCEDRDEEWSVQEWTVKE